MKAAYFEQYGPPDDVVVVREIPRPVPKSNEVLVRVHCASLNAFDWRIVSASPFLVRMEFGWRKPNLHTPGVDLAGTVVEIGSIVVDFEIGDAVFGMNFGGKRVKPAGTCAEYVCVREDLLAKKSPNVSFTDVAALPLAGLTALQGLRDYGELEEDQEVLINGAGGGVGIYAVQFAKRMKGRVTAVCSTEKVHVIKDLGADRVIDYKTEDCCDTDIKYDLIFDAAAYRPIGDYRNILKPNGIYVYIGGSNMSIFQAVILKGMCLLNKSQTVVIAETKPKRIDLLYMQDLLEHGELKNIISEQLTLGQTGRGIRKILDDHSLGKIMILPSSDQ